MSAGADSTVCMDSRHVGMRPGHHAPVHHPATADQTTWPARRSTLRYTGGSGAPHSVTVWRFDATINNPLLLNLSHFTPYPNTGMVGVARELKPLLDLLISLTFHSTLPPKSPGIDCLYGARRS